MTEAQFPKQRQAVTLQGESHAEVIQAETISRSPVPPSSKKPVEMNFAQALDATLDGKRITRLSWESNDTFGQMKENELSLFIRGEFHSWTIVPGDIIATDWIILPE